IFLIFNDYQVDIIRYNYDITKDNGNMLTLLNKETIDNIVDCEEIDNNLILESMGLCAWSKSVIEE
ncbi:MAG: hypothetical protein ACI4PF_02565, partial [Christensenellales bacterium]